jgi:hypothetical protein
MIGESKLKFKFNPTPTLAKLYEQQGLYQDALRIYEYLTDSGKCDFAHKVIELKAKLDPDYVAPEKDASLTEIVLSKESKTASEEILFEVTSPKDVKKDLASKEKHASLPEYQSLINILFTDEEKSYFQIVPSDEFYFNKKKELVSIFTNNENRQSYYPVGDDMIDNKQKDYHEILDANEDINPEVTVEDFVNILYTYYSKNTKISEIKIGDLFLLLSSIKLENS